MSFPNVTLKSNAVAVLGISLAGPTGSLNEVTGSVEEPLIQEVTTKLREGSVSSRVMLADSLFV